MIPTRCIKTSTFDVAGQGLERLSLKIYDTPGLALDVDDNGGVTEKERGVSGLLCIVSHNVDDLNLLTIVDRRQAHCGVERRGQGRPTAAYLRGSVDSSG